MCEFNGCHNLIKHGKYCAEHAYSKDYRIKHKHHRSVWHHDNKPVYHSDKWKSVCEVVDLREHNMCQRCGKIVFGKDKQHHHIIPIKQDPSLKFEPRNIMLLCARCHPIVEHEQEENPKPVYPSYFD